MKVFIRVLSVTLVALMLCVSLASCARIPKGEYLMGDKVLDGCYEGYTFKGSKFSYDVYINYVRQDDLCFSGKYKIEESEEETEEGILEGNITLTWLDAEGAEVSETRSLMYDEIEGVLVIGDLVYNLFVGEE